MGAQARIRRETAISFTGKQERWTNPSSKSTYALSLKRGKYMADEINHGWSPKAAGRYDAGGPLFAEDYGYEGISPGYLNLHTAYHAQGDFLPVRHVWDPTIESSQVLWHSLPILVSDMDLVTSGTTAISRCAPTNPHASVYNTVGELRRDGIPAISGLNAFRKKGSPDSLGGEYLNVEFGWKPFISDLRKLAKAVVKSEEILDKYRRESGRIVHRSYRFPTEVDTTTEFVGRGSYHTASVPSKLWANPLDPYCDYHRTQTIQTERWFKGAFTYKSSYDGDAVNSIRSAAQEANHLLGILPTPAAVWNLTPWTWALDWFANTGDVINNASMMLTDGLAMVYGYIMEKKTVTTRHHIDNLHFVQGSNYRSTVTTRYVRRRRKAAFPFGFGLTFDGFSPSQMAIMAALGLSQSGRYVAK